MRTIKFRGKGKKDGKWYFGNLYDIDTYGRTHICTINRGCFDIDPNTVGQFTGLYDKNGNEIYEGDVLSVGGEYNVVCEFKHGAFGYSRFGRFNVFAISAKFLVKKEFKVIGNIHDNPELLKGGEK